jgi:hypothetical protein
MIGRFQLIIFTLRPPFAMCDMLLKGYLRKTWIHTMNGGTGRKHTPGFN